MLTRRIRGNMKDKGDGRRDKEIYKGPNRRTFSVFYNSRVFPGWIHRVTERAKGILSGRVTVKKKRKSHHSWQTLLG